MASQAGTVPSYFGKFRESHAEVDAFDDLFLNFFSPIASTDSDPVRARGGE